MVTIRAPHPRQFFFKCQTHGRYRVSEETLRKFISRQMEKELNRNLEKGAHGAVLEFAEFCPQCDPNGFGEVTLSALWPRLN